MSKKSEFLKQAQDKYKEAVANKWIAEMNFIFSPSLILRVWFDPNMNPNAEDRETGFMHRWCTVDTLPVDEEKKIIRQAGQILSANTDEEIAKMVDILRRSLKHQPDQTIDYIDGITTWHNVEYSFTVKSACEYIGLIK